MKCDIIKKRLGKNLFSLFFNHMYLEKLEIHGFKSFADKNTLLFPGLISGQRRGITAVVGPNGSGKSNVADSVRWVLGEQSIKTLRGKKSEDVIFSGSDQKQRLGMAEVSMYLNNESHQVKDDDKTSPLNYDHLKITRRIFRDGENDYLINDNKVRLSEIQILLAKAKFGQKTYSVIGQGMVENFLNVSSQERKAFFDEATGVKQYQIKRDLSLNKLQNSYENLQQAEVLLQEIEPRLKSLTRQVNRLKRRGDIEQELTAIQFQYYGKSWQEINEKFNLYNQELLELEKNKIAKDRQLDKLNDKLSKMETSHELEEKIRATEKEIEVERQEKNRLEKNLAKLEAEIELQLEASGQFDLSWLTKKQSEINHDLNNLTEEIDQLEKNTINNQTNSRQESLNQINGKIHNIQSKIRELEVSLVGSGEGEIKKIAAAFLKTLEDLEKEEEIAKIKELIVELKNRFNQEIITYLETGHVQKNWQETQNKIRELQHQIDSLNLEKETAYLELNKEQLLYSNQNERRKLLLSQKNRLEQELQDIKTKLTKTNTKIDTKEIEKEKKILSEEIDAINNRMKGLTATMDQFKDESSAEKSALFSMQKETQTLQQEINHLSNKLNELKINVARQETKLEELEKDIRDNNVDFAKIKKEKILGEIDFDLLREKINSLRGQLDTIGGIDPETEKEYTETKERFDFLSTQTKDLNGAIASLEKIIAELDQTIKEKFDTEFKVICEKFSEYFRILFNGGSAKIFKVMLEEEKEGSENKKEAEEESEQKRRLKKIKFLRRYNSTGLAGIDVTATPPGKKISSVAMLSGGERALTAIALISAIISANPAPFVVLDEVDAALDEANSERLAQILNDLSNKTQFIIITHNRASMHKASILYGITMRSDGVSKLVSVKLEDIKVE